MILSRTLRLFAGMLFVMMLFGASVSPGVTAAQAGISTSDVYEYDPFPIAGDRVDGAWSQLVRTDSGVSMTMNTSGLTSGAYTIWWGVFNRPEFCQTSPCTVSDLRNPDTAAAVIHATGHVVGENGTGNFAADLATGEDPGAIFGQLTNPRGAEIHLIVKNHGEVIPDLVDEQIHTIGGGCVENFGGPNCPDVQFSIHQP